MGDQVKWERMCVVLIKKDFFEIKVILSLKFGTDKIYTMLLWIVWCGKLSQILQLNGWSDRLAGEKKNVYTMRVWNWIEQGNFELIVVLTMVSSRRRCSQPYGWTDGGWAVKLTITNEHFLQKKSKKQTNIFLDRWKTPLQKSSNTCSNGAFTMFPFVIRELNLFPILNSLFRFITPHSIANL